MVSAPAPAGSPLTIQMLRGLRVAQTSIVLVVLLTFFLPNLLASLEVYPSAAVGLGCFAGMAAIALVDAVLVWRDRFWGAGRWVAAAAAIAISLAVTSSLPAADLVRPAHWTLGATGFLGVLLFCDVRLDRMIGYVGVHVATMAGALVLVGRSDADTWVQFGIVVVATEGLHIAVAMASSALRSVAADATAAAEDRAAGELREAVAGQVHADRERRYALLRESVLPLLRGIRDGSLPASDQEVRRRAAAESARLRRVFVGTDDLGGVLAGELEALVEDLGPRGSAVVLACRPIPVEPPEVVRRDLVATAGGILRTTDGPARLTLGASDGYVVVALVVDGTVTGAYPVGPGDIVCSVTTHDGRTWMEARWSEQAPPR